MEGFLLVCSVFRIGDIIACLYANGKDLVERRQLMLKTGCAGKWRGRVLE